MILSAWNNPTGYGINDIRINTGGSGYTAPTAVATGGGGSGCILGTPVMSGGVITSIPITTAGSGYTTPPTITITDGTGTGAIAMPEAAVQPATPSWLAYGAPATGWWVGECVTAVPHLMKFGQPVRITGNSTVQVSNGPTNPPFSVIINGVNLTAYPTGPTTFAFTDFGGAATNGTGLPASTNNVAGTFAVSYTGTVNIPEPGVQPYEAAAQESAALGTGCVHYVNIPVACTDACSLAIANAVFGILPSAQSVLVEYSLENWNYNFSYFTTFASAQLGAGARSPSRRARETPLSTACGPNSITTSGTGSTRVWAAPAP